MKLNKNMTKIAAALVLLGSMGAAHAGTATGKQTATADLVFAAPSDTVNLTITPVANLTAGQLADNTLVGSILAHPPVTTDVVGIRWTPGHGVVGAEALSFMVQVSGKTATNKLSVGFSIGPGARYDGKSGYWHDANTKGDLKASISLYGAQNVAADTYEISMDAAVYTA